MNPPPANPPAGPDGPGPSAISITGFNPPQMPLPPNFTVSGVLNPMGGVVNGHLWDSNGNLLTAPGANPSANSSPVDGTFNLPFSITISQQASYTLKLVYLDPSDPASLAQAIQIAPQLAPEVIAV